MAMQPNLNKIYRKAPQVKGVVPGGTARLDLDPGYKYHRLDFYCGGTSIVPLTHFPSLKVFLNDKVTMEVPTAVLNAQNKFDDIADANTSKVISLFFERPKLRGPMAEQDTAINLGPNGPSGQARTLAVEFEVAASAPADVSLQCKMEVSPAIPGAGAGTIRRILPHYRNLSGAGTLEVADIVHNDPSVGFINRIIYPSADVTEVELERGNRTIWKRTKAENEYLQKDVFKRRVPQTGYFIVDTTEQGNGYEMIKTIGFSNFRHIIQCSAAVNMPIYMDTLGTLAAID